MIGVKAQDRLLTLFLLPCRLSPVALRSLCPPRVSSDGRSDHCITCTRASFCDFIPAPTVFLCLHLLSTALLVLCRPFGSYSRHGLGQVVSRQAKQYAWRRTRGSRYPGWILLFSANLSFSGNPNTRGKLQRWCHVYLYHIWRRHW